MVSQNVLSSGAVALSAASLVVSSGTKVQSSNNSVTLTSVGNVTLQPGSRVSANRGNGQVGINSTAAGSAIDVSGAITAQKAEISTVAGNDAINLFQLPVNVPLTVNGGTASSSLYIPGTAGNDTFNINAASVELVGVETVTYSKINALDIESLAGNDTFNVNGTSATKGTTLNGTGSDTLHLSTNASANAPVLFDVSANDNGPNTVFVTGNLAGGDEIVAASNGYVTDSNLPVPPTAPGIGDVISTGLQLQYASNTTALNFTLPGASSKLWFLGSQAATMVQALGANDAVYIGGAPTGITVGGTQATFHPMQHTGPTGTASATFLNSITVNGTAGAGTALSFDDSQGATVTAGILDPTSVRGLGEDQTNVHFQFTGIHNLTLNLGNTGGQQFTVDDTLADTTGNVTINAGSGYSNLVTVYQTTAPLVVTGTFAGTGTKTDVVFVDCTGTSAIANALLADAPGSGSPATTARLTGFGPITDVTFSGFGEADLNEGSGGNTLTLNTSATSAALNVNAGSGDDILNVLQIGATTNLNGNAAHDTVNVIVPSTLSNLSDLTMLNLPPQVTQVVIDNSGNSTAVNWEADNDNEMGYVHSGTTLYAVPELERRRRRPDQGRKVGQRYARRVERRKPGQWNRRHHQGHIGDRPQRAVIRLRQQLRQLQQYDGYHPLHQPYFA